ncbi:MAG: hypothetical protein U1C73_10770 [Dietzia sp.]|nr:hypothetical protein [Dietzia sp.]
MRSPPGRRWPRGGLGLARDLAAAGVLAYLLDRVVKTLVGLERPDVLLDELTLRRLQGGLGFPSGIRRLPWRWPRPQRRGCRGPPTQLGAMAGGGSRCAAVNAASRSGP